MKHHFGDMLDRTGEYWTIIPNRERYRKTLAQANQEDSILTILGSDSDFERLSDFPNLEELTLHEPTKEQLSYLGSLTRIKRLRITHARPKDISFLEDMNELEELVLEYVSGFSDLSPLGQLPKLRSIHCENLRKVSCFDGLEGLVSLRFLSIYGTLDWKQPIENFSFVEGLPNLEVLALWQTINRSDFPATLPIALARSLKRLKIPWNELVAEEYALLDCALKDVEGTDWGPYTAFQRAENDVWFEFTGKGAGATKKGSKNEVARCAEYSKRYEELKDQAKTILKKHNQTVDTTPVSAPR